MNIHGTDIFYMIFIFFIFWFSLVFVYIITFINRVIKKALKKFIIPTLEDHNMKFIRVEKLRYQSTPFKEVGDFEGLLPPNPFFDTNFNRKVYCDVYFSDMKLQVHRVTVRIHLNMISRLVRIEFAKNLDEIIE